MAIPEDDGENTARSNRQPLQESPKAKRKSKPKAQAASHQKAASPELQQTDRSEAFFLTQRSEEDLELPPIDNKSSDGKKRDSPKKQESPKKPESPTPAPRGRRPRPQTPQREESVPLFDLNKGRMNTTKEDEKPNQSKSTPFFLEDTKSKKVERTETEESIPLLDLKNVNQKGSGEPVVLKSNPQRADKVYRSYKDKNVSEAQDSDDTGAGYKPTWLTSTTSKPTAKSKATPLRVI